MALALACGSCDSDKPTAEPAAAAKSRPTSLQRQVGVDDVSFLFPLPDTSRRLSLLGASESGLGGALLAFDTFQRLPTLDAILSNGELYYFLRVLGVRIDPCFPGLDPAAPCKNQVRLVMQPVTVATRGSGLTTMDLAVHLFYEMSRQELAGLYQEMVDLRAASSVELREGPVGVHPALQREGVEGPFATAFREALLARIGAQNLVRVTFMGIEQVGQIWRFGGYDVQDGQLVPLKIPLIDVADERFFNRDLDGLTFAASSTAPASPTPDDISLLFDPERLPKAPDDERREAYRHAVRIENPKIHSPDTIDCVTCHVTMAARRHAERAFPQLMTDVVPERYAHARGLPLDGATVERTNELRAFGYFNERPSISQRVVNETAAVVELVNTAVRSR